MQKAGSIHQYAASYFAGASLVALLNGCGIDTLPGQGKSDVPRPQPETTRDVSTLTAREEIVGEPGGEAARAPAVERQPEGTGEIQKTVERLAAHKRIVNLRA
jgi:hypothetical protein